MQKAIQILMGEHRVIESVLGALERHAALVRGGLAVERPTVARFAVFFRDFADATHHGKEEDILFRKMAESGLPTESGPLAVMLHEHDQGREPVDVSLNSELVVLAALSQAAQRRGRLHNVIVMVDLVDLREGLWPTDLNHFIGKALRLDGIRVVGLGTNLVLLCRGCAE